MSPRSDVPHVVIVGGGFAGAYCAQALERYQRRGLLRITVINRKNFFVFTPLLVEAGTGALEPRHAVVPLRSFIRQASLHMAEVESVDLDRRQVVSRTFDGLTHAFQYDHLVLAVGSVTKLPDVPGLREHGFEMKSLADAVALRDRAIGLLELANATDDRRRRHAMLTFVIVGGNFSGVELAGEFNEFLTNAARLYGNLDAGEVSVFLVEHQPRVLHILDEDLAEYASNCLQRRGVKLRLENTVTHIGPDYADLKGGERVPTWTVIWTAGIAPNPLLAKLNVPRDLHGYVLCDSDLRVRNVPNVWAIGDCAVNPGPDGQPYPPTAQHAVREGRQAARNVARVLRGQATEPLVYRSKGMMAPLGQHQGVARIFRWRLSGLPAWLLWRTFYLIRMPGISRSLRVMADWTLDWFFRRDYVQLGIHGTHDPSVTKDSPGVAANDNETADASSGPQNESHS
jgi:NADH dehydrogenase